MRNFCLISKDCSTPGVRYFITKTVFRLILFSFLSFTPSILFAQDAPQKVLGTFIYDQQVFNYEFIKQDVDNYSLKITRFSPDIKNPVEKDSLKTELVKAKDGNGLDTLKITDSSAVTSPPKHNKVTTQNEASPSTGEKLGYIFSEFSQGVFTSVFIDQMSNILGIEKSKPIDDKSKSTDDKSKSIDDKNMSTDDKNKLLDNLNKLAAGLFVKIQSKLDFLDDEPVTANLMLRKNTVTSILRANESEYYDGRLSGLLAGHDIVKVRVETEDGAIKNVFVDVVKPGTPIKDGQVLTNFITFKNQYPISISSRNDPTHFSDIKLYSYNCYGIKGLTRYIKLSDVLQLDIVLENDKEDYSPANSLVYLSPSSPIKELKKEKRSKILEVTAFTDFVGMDQEQPNGLIQIEAKRKINLNTKYRPFNRLKKVDDALSKLDLGNYNNYPGRPVKTDSGTTYTLKFKDDTLIAKKVIIKKHIVATNKNTSTTDSVLVKDKIEREKKITIPKGSFHSSYYNTFGSIEPRLLFSKLEENKKFLILDDANIAGNKVTALKLFQYQLASFGLNLNALKFAFPEPKININFDVGAYWFRTRAKTQADSAGAASAALNSSYITAGINFVFRPDSRWGVSTGIAYLKQNLWNGAYKIDHNDGFTQVSFDAYLKTNDDSKMFFRYRWTFDGHTFNNNFTQVQLGYSMNIFVSKGNAK